MAKSKKEIIMLYKNLRKVCSEMSEYISDLSKDKKRDDSQRRYLSEFIQYKNLEEEFIYFREDAQEEVDENMPFSNLTL